MKQPDDLALIYTAAGQAEAAWIKSLLEANEIPVMAVQEGAGAAYGLTVGVLGEVNLFVPARFQAEAAAILEPLETGPDDDQSANSNLT